MLVFRFSVYVDFYLIVVSLLGYEADFMTLRFINIGGLIYSPDIFQVDDPLATDSPPGIWSLNSAYRVVEDSGIHGAVNAPKCPPNTDAVGTQLLFAWAYLVSSSAVEREVCVFYRFV